MPVEEFHKLRYNVSYVLKVRDDAHCTGLSSLFDCGVRVQEMEDLEKRGVMQGP